MELLQSSLLELDEADGADLVQSMKKDKTLMAAITTYQTGQTPPRTPGIDDQIEYPALNDYAVSVSLKKAEKTFFPNEEDFRSAETCWKLRVMCYQKKIRK